ncbi:MAG: hypothetical protein HYV78_01650 [Candidatus Wildermuthbacteria bacterium]|nr:hypothetical protein [Candidatus Wildermuthbacteria bacterium]
MISFREKNGYEIEGCWMPRVTAITSVVSKPGLSRYYEEFPDATSAELSLAKSADWGILTHLTLQKIISGEKKKVDSKIVPSVRAFLKWQKEHSLTVLNPAEDIERRVVDRDSLYAGTIDLLAEIDGTRGIVDIKTSSGIWEEYSLQTAAYLNAYHKTIGQTLFHHSLPLSEKRWILRVDQHEECMGCLAKKRTKDGRHRVQGGKRTCNHQWSAPTAEIEFKELTGYRQDLEAFLAAKELWEWYHKKSLKKISNYPKHNRL